MMKLKGAAIALAAMSAILGAQSAQAVTITFDEFAATNDNSAITTLYSGVGVTFSGTNAGIWGGIANGDPGSWGVDGTNGPQFLGYNGPYAETISFTTAISSFSADFSRTDGSIDGAITLSAYAGVTLVGSTVVVLGPINSWSTAFLSGAGIDRIELSGAGTSFHPFAIDNIVLDGRIAVPEPATWALMIMGFGLVGAAQRRRAVTVSFG